jgi:hypothetical protein
MKIKMKKLASVVFVLGALTATTAFAGRPLSVDDANVNDAGAGHVEFWYARQPGDVNVWTVAPAYGVVDGIEIGAALARDTSNNLSTTSLQVKFRITESKKSGCNVGAVLGASQPNDGSGNTPYINGLMSCNGEAGSLHINLGGNRGPNGPTLGTWGVAVEREFGAVTAHAEAFGQEQSAPVVQLGLRTMVLKTLQLDGTVGSTNGQSVFTLGLKFLF